MAKNTNAANSAPLALAAARPDVGPAIQAASAEASAIAEAEHMQLLASVEAAVIGQSLAEVRSAYADATNNTRAANMAYAFKLNEVLPHGWFNMLGDIPQRRKGITDASELAIFDERVAHHATLRARLGIGTNPSPNWKRVATYASELATGARDILGNKVKVPASGEGSEGGAARGEVNPSRSPLLRNVEELLKLWKANEKVQGDEKIGLAQQHITNALKVLGCDPRLSK